MRRDLAICGCLVLLTLAAYARLGQLGFVNFHDPGYVYANPVVRQGLTWDNVQWAFRSSEQGNWHPLTWLSHMFDAQFFQVKHGSEWMHHAVSLAFHVANTLLLFFVLRAMTGAFWRSAMVAALFALHPLHVESVAWVSERKDVLSTFFGLLAIGAYVAYARRPGLGRYLLVLLPFVLSLMAKPMLVTLPFVLLLLDYWPLGRLWIGGAAATVAAGEEPPETIFSLVIEKVPMFVFTTLSCYITYQVQRADGARGGGMPVLELGTRIENALLSYVAYIGKMFWPTDLTVLYPMREHHALSQVLGAAALLAGVSALVIWAALRGRQYLAVGWFWYLGTLVPVIGLVQTGDQVMADHYTYVPLIGLLIMLAWGARDLAARWGIGPRLLLPASAALLFACTVLTFFQVGVWTSSETLFGRAIEIFPDCNPVAYHNLARAETVRADSMQDHEQARALRDQAIEHYRTAIRQRPGYAEAHNNLGLVYSGMGKKEAFTEFAAALKADPKHAGTHHSLGVMIMTGAQRLPSSPQRSQLLEAAASEFRQAVDTAPDSVGGWTGLGTALLEQAGEAKTPAEKQRLEESIACYRRALSIDRTFPMAHHNLGKALVKKASAESGEAADDLLEEAVQQYRLALENHPEYFFAHYSLGLLLAQRGQWDEAIEQYQQAVAIRPNHYQTHTNLGMALAQQRRWDEAIAHYRQALTIKPSYEKARLYLERARLSAEQAQRQP